MKPSLKSANYFDAINVFLELSEVLLSGNSIHSLFDDFISLACFSIFLFFIGYSLYSCYAQQKKVTDFEECRKKLTDLDKMKADMASKKYVCVSCPICLTDFDIEESEKDDKVERKNLKHKKTNLKCGHSFCEECISKWFNQGENSCPVCREKIDETQPQNNRKDVDYNPELEFRLNRVHFYYPTYVPQTIINPHYNGSYANNTYLTTLDPSRISSSSSSFGGGFSFGGGGGGGSW